MQLNRSVALVMMLSVVGFCRQPVSGSSEIEVAQTTEQQAPTSGTQNPNPAKTPDASAKPADQTQTAPAANKPQRRASRSSDPLTKRLILTGAILGAVILIGVISAENTR